MKRSFALVLTLVLCLTMMTWAQADPLAPEVVADDANLIEDISSEGEGVPVKKDGVLALEDGTMTLDTDPEVDIVDVHLDLDAEPEASLQNAGLAMANEAGGEFNLHADRDEAANEVILVYCPDDFFASMLAEGEDRVGDHSFLSYVEAGGLAEDERVESWETSDGSIAVVKYDSRYGCSVRGLRPGVTELTAITNKNRSDSIRIEVVELEALPIDEAHFPDPAFREYICAQYWYSIQEMGVNVISRKEAEDLVRMDTCIDEIDGNVTWHYLYDSGIKSLKGIEYFTGLTFLNCSGNQLTQLDISKNTKLEVLFCYDNQLTSLDVSHCPNLYSLDFRDNMISDIDMSGCPVIRALYCTNNRLSELDVSHNPGLSDLYCEANSINYLDISSASELIECFENGKRTYHTINGKDNIEFKIDKSGIDITVSGEQWPYHSNNLAVDVGSTVAFNDATYTVPGRQTEPTDEPSEPSTEVQLSECKITVKNQVYTGKAIKPAVTVKYGKKTLKKGTDYTISYKNNKAIGVATATVKGKGNYTGSKKVTFQILPRATKISKLTAGKQSVTVAWAKRAEATGYQVQYALKSNFAGAKSVRVKKAGTIKTTIKSLKAGKKYYVRVRTYKSVGKKTYYSAWSKAKSVTVK